MRTFPSVELGLNTAKVSRQSSLDIESYQGVTSRRNTRASERDIEASCVFLDCLKAARYITRARTMWSVGPTNPVLREVIGIIEDDCLQQLEKMLQLIPSITVFASIKNHGSFETSIAPIELPSGLESVTSSSVHKSVAEDHEMLGQAEQVALSEFPGRRWHSLSTPASSSMSPAPSYIGRENYLNIGTPSNVKDIKLQDHTDRFLHAAVSPSAPGYASGEGFDSPGHPEFSAADLYPSSNIKVPSSCPSIDLEICSRFDQLELRQGFERGVSTTSNQWALYRTNPKGLDNMFTPCLDQRTHDIEYQADDESAKDVIQAKPVNDMNALCILQGEQAEAQLSIEIIRVKDDEVELSDVENESNASKIFSSNIYTTCDGEVTYKPSRVRLIKQKSTGVITVHTERDLDGRRDMIQFEVGHRSEIIPLYALSADPPGAAEILLRNDDGWDCGLRYRFYRNNRKNPTELFGFQGALMSMAFDAEYRLVSINFCYRRGGHNMTIDNVLAQLWTDKSSHPAVGKFIETFRRGSHSHGDFSLQAFDNIKAKVASSRIFIFANNSIYIVIGIHLPNQQILL
jgi:hypothetical protein